MKKRIKNKTIFNVAEESYARFTAAGPGGNLHSDDMPCENTDRQLWSRNNNSFSPSIHVTKEGNIGINVGGHVIVMPVEMWHRCGKLRSALQDVSEAIL